MELQQGCTIMKALEVIKINSLSIWIVEDFVRD
jgi:hypothetical protein